MSNYYSADLVNGFKSLQLQTERLVDLWFLEKASEIVARVKGDFIHSYVNDPWVDDKYFSVNLRDILKRAEDEPIFPYLVIFGEFEIIKVTSVEEALTRLGQAIADGLTVEVANKLQIKERFSALHRNLHACKSECRSPHCNDLLIVNRAFAESLES